ncbi:hypothetical protein OG912_32280 [Streptomyces sp. NBC_00464]|uniref:hypothetical protein n=1 Tax=Streptomyces sp. NBC_00464 TaxID=2975751 RepID=UPI002E172AF5
MTDADEHVCKPGASEYFCPQAGEIESDCHGGFDVCCGRPDLHIGVLSLCWAPVGSAGWQRCVKPPKHAGDCALKYDPKEEN